MKLAKPATSSSLASSASAVDGQAPLLTFLHNFYTRVGKFVGRHPVKVIIFCTALSAICGAKMVFTEKENDLLAYAPAHAPSRVEYAAYQEFFDNHGQGIMIYVLITAKDNGTLIRAPHLNESVQVLDLIYTNFTIFNPNNGKQEAFTEFCQGFCLINEPVRQFHNGYKIQNAQLLSSDALNPRVNLTYPVTTMFNRHFTIQAHFFGVETYTEEELTEAHDRNATSVSNLKSVSLIALQIRAERRAWWTDDDIANYEVDIPMYFKRNFNSSVINVVAISPSYVGKEIERSGLSLQPLIMIGFLIMTAFTVVTTIASSLFARQFSWHRITMAVAACVCPLMSVATAFGIIFSCGFRFGPICAVTPLLILAIGVDDSFLMMHAWQRIVSRVRSKEVHTDCIENRISMVSGHRSLLNLVKVVAETGSSITLSAVTNILAFGVGALTAPPEISLFSLVNAFALFVDTTYSVTLYAAIMAVAGRFEMMEEDDKEEVEENKFVKKAKELFYELLDWYIELTSRMSTILIVLVGLLAFWAVSFYGGSQLGIDLSSDKFFLKDSDLLVADKLKQQFVIPYFTAPGIFINSPGNLSDFSRKERLDELVAKLEALSEAIGPLSTNYFLRDYGDFLTAFSDPEFAEGESEDQRHEHLKSLWSLDGKLLEEFLEWPEYSYWKGFMRLSDIASEPIEKFFFTTGFAGERLKHWELRHAILDDWRDVVAEFSDFNATVYYDDALFLDLVQILPSVTWQSVAATLVCMAIACFVFFVDVFTVSTATLAILSICVGELGFLHFYGITLDPILMSALIMSIGFSVDIPAHICYHYYRTKFAEDDVTVAARLRHTLSAVGFPVVQAGVSTNLCVLCFLIVPMYMGEVFVLCMLLCISLGLLFGLFVLPVLFNVQDRISKAMKRQACYACN